MSGRFDVTKASDRPVVDGGRGRAVRRPLRGLAWIPGVQRQAARGAVDSLRGAVIIEPPRGALTITDRAGLEAGPC